MNEATIKDDDILVINTQTDAKPTRVSYDPLPVYTEGHPFLKMETKEVLPEEIKTPDFQQAIGQLKATMRQYGAVGISANQCGLNLRLFVLGTDVFQMACINPKIIATEGEMVKVREGCVSFPALFINVPRYQRIQVEYLNENGELTTTWMDGITAQCFQHELDHMNGICYTDKVGPLSVQMAKKRQAKMIKMIKRSMR
jgi:peptide deformylase